jgi:hypothetical protein
MLHQSPYEFQQYITVQMSSNGNQPSEPANTMHLRTIAVTCILATIVTCLPKKHPATVYVDPDPIGWTSVTDGGTKVDDLYNAEGCKNSTGRPQYARIEYGYKCAFY